MKTLTILVSLLIALPTFALVEENQPAEPQIEKMALAKEELGGLAGRWSGQATMTFGEDAQTAKCVAHYYPAGSNVKQKLGCSNPSMNVNLESMLTLSGESLSGKWEEKNYSQGGDLAGTMKDGVMKLKIGGSLTGRMVISTKGCNQNVSIHFDNTALPKIKIAMRKC